MVARKVAPVGANKVTGTKSNVEENDHAPPSYAPFARLRQSPGEYVNRITGETETTFTRQHEGP